MSNTVLDSVKAYTQNIKAMAVLLSNMGLKVITLGFYKKDAVQASDFCGQKQHVILLKRDNKILSQIKMYILSMKTILKYKPNNILISTNYNHLNLIYVATIKLLEILGIKTKVVFYIQDPIPETFTKVHKIRSRFMHKIILKILTIIEKILISASDIIMYPSIKVYSLIYSRNNIERKVLLFIPNILSLMCQSRFNIDQYLARNTNMNTGPCKEEKVINLVYIGKIQPNIRGLEEQLIILKKLKSLGINAQLIIYGEGYVSNLLKLAEKMDIRELVRYEGIVPYNFLINIMKRKCGILIIPSINYLLPSKLFESLVMGLVLIVPKDNIDIVRILKPCLLAYNSKNNLPSILKILINLYYSRNMHIYRQCILNYAPLIIGTMANILRRNVRRLASLLLS